MLAIFYRNFTKTSSYYSHVGLGVGAMHTARVLQRHSIRTRVFGIRQPSEIAPLLRQQGPFRFVVIEALWVDTLEALLEEFPTTEFLVRNHSQVGFLQVEPGAVRLLRRSLHLQEVTTNFRVAANSERFCRWVRTTYGSDCLALPNLYDANRASRRHRAVPHAGPVKIGSFGATRLLKLHPTAASAALMVARNRGTDLKFYVNVNRNEQGTCVLETIREMYRDVPWAKLVEVPWTPWPEFRHQIAAMHACIQVSATETFNLVTADAVAEGVPSAVGPAIDWAPDHWKTRIDDPAAIARTVELLLDDRYAQEEGLTALADYNELGVIRWKQALKTTLQD